MPGRAFGDLRVLRCLIWCGPAFTVILGSGFLLGRYLPPHSPSWSAQEVADRYVDHRNLILVANILLFTGAMLWTGWVAALTAWIRRFERGVPVLSYVSLMLGTIGTVLLCVYPLLWTAAAYRAGDESPDLIRALNDLGWLIFIWGVQPFTLWVMVVFVPLFWQDEGRTLIPRWALYLSIFFATDLMLGTLCVFFKSGPLAWNGILAFWNLSAVYAIWMAGTTVCLLRAVRVMEQRTLAVPSTSE